MLSNYTTTYTGIKNIFFCQYHLFNMSLHYWNIAYKQRELNAIGTTTCVLYMSPDIYDPTGSDAESEGEEEELSTCLPLLFTLTTLEKHAKVYSPIEDTSIDFNCRLTIANFDKS